MTKLFKSNFFRSFLTIIIVVSLNILVGVIIILSIGSNPITALNGLFQFSLGSMDSITNVLTRVAPLLMSGLAVAIAFSAGVFNLGIEGQVYLGAIAAAIAGFSIEGLSKIIHLPIILLASMMAGAIGAWIPGWLKIKFNINEGLSGMLLTSIYILLTQYFANDPFRDPDRWSGTTPNIQASGNLPVLFPDSSLNVGFVISIITIILIFLLMNYCDIGYRWRMIGRNLSFSKYAGCNVDLDWMKAILLSGVLAGLSGGLMVTGSQFSFWNGMCAGIGWDGVLIALLANNNPLWVLVAGSLIAAIRVGALGIEVIAKVPSELIDVQLAFLILIFIGRKAINWKHIISKTMKLNREK